MTWFHSSDGFFWERLGDGSVRLTRRTGAREDGEIEVEHVLLPSSWASVVASVSAGGEAGGRFYVAEAFHAGHGEAAPRDEEREALKLVEDAARRAHEARLSGSDRRRWGDTLSVELVRGLDDIDEALARLDAVRAARG